MTHFTSRSCLLMASALVKLAVLLLWTGEHLYRRGWLGEEAMLTWIGQVRALRRRAKRLSSLR